MRTFTRYKTDLGSGKWEVGWKEGDTILCSMRLSLAGTDDAVDQALAVNTAALRERNSSLFYDDTEPVTMMEDMA